MLTKFLAPSEKTKPRVKKKGDGRTIYGYAATWDEDTIGDIIVKGAFSKTIKERGPRNTEDGIRSKIKLGYNHGVMVGIPTLLKEDDYGLYYEGKVSKTKAGDDLIELVDDGVVDVNSFMYDIVDFDEESQPGKRMLKELKVYELGPVDFACNEVAFLGGLKSRNNASGLYMAVNLAKTLTSLDYEQCSMQLIKQLEKTQQDLADFLKRAGEQASPPEPRKAPAGSDDELIQKLDQVLRMMKG